MTTPSAACGHRQPEVGSGQPPNPLPVAEHLRCRPGPASPAM